MFERFVKLSQAREALRKGQLEGALGLSSDPAIAGHKAARKVRESAILRLLERAEERVKVKKWAAARLDIERILQEEPESSSAQRLAVLIDEGAGDTSRREDEARAAVRSARAAAEKGEGANAARLLLTAKAVLGDAAECLAAEGFLRARREAAVEHLEAAKAATELMAAAAEFARARALDADAPGLANVERKLVQRLTQQVVREIDAALATSPAAAWAAWRRVGVLVPALGAAPGVEKLLARIATAEAKSVRRRVSDVEGGVLAAREFLASDAELLARLELVQVVRGAEALVSAVEAESRGALAVASDDFALAAELLGASELSRRGRQLGKRAGRVQAEVARARKFSDEGDAQKAREVLTAVVTELPTHGEARRELEMLDQGVRQREEALASARDAARDGRLQEASATAMSLAVPGPAGDEARLLLDDVRARMDLVSRGLDEIRASLHSRTSGTVSGMQHSLRRLEELAKVQCDHGALEELRTALQAEIDGLEILQGAPGQRPEELVASLGRLEELRSKLLAADRLDARILALGDNLCDEAEESLRGGQLGRAESLRRSLHAIAAVSGGISDRAQKLESDIESARVRALDAVESARTALAARSLSEAEQKLERALASWTDCPDARRLEAEVAAVRSQEAAIADVEGLAEERDFAAAQRLVSELPPTPAVLRTKIFDMKQGLAKAQGLDGGFVLRVDEGGEYVVVRGDSVTLGNVRDSRSDLPILANLASKHARIERSMSFHGGMEDAVYAEGGAVRIDGRDVVRHPLRSGDVVGLGGTFQFRYDLPSKRSLSARLRILGGFQVAGTDRVLLLKDRGRDGRILIGGAKDAHVPISGAPEVEIYASGSGQITVRCKDGGAVDGVPFRGEHPVVAGVPVTCGSVSFVLQPWNPTAV